MKTFIHWWQYVAEFFVEWDIFHTNVAEKNQNTHYMFSNVFPINLTLYETMEKYDRARQATND